MSEKTAKATSEKTVKAASEGAKTAGLRPKALTLSSLIYGATGVYYLAYPLLIGDPTIVPLYAIGSLSVLGSLGVLRMSRWGLWLGLLLFPVQVIAPAFALQVALQLPGLTQNVQAISFAASLVGLLFLACLSFLLLLDNKKTFK